jgi:hypothetical protein
LASGQGDKGWCAVSNQLILIQNKKATGYVAFDRSLNEKIIFV